MVQPARDEVQRAGAAGPPTEALQRALFANDKATERKYRRQRVEFLSLISDRKSVFRTVSNLVILPTDWTWQNNGGGACNGVIGPSLPCSL